MAPYFAVRITAGQEKSTALLIHTRCISRSLPIKAIIAPDEVKGLFFIESPSSHLVERAIAGMKHVKGWVPGKVASSEIESFLIPRSPLEDLNVGDVVEIISGPFRGMKGKVTRIDHTKEEVTLELLEAAYTLPITVHGDSIKKVTG
ncbi:MAG: transcription elongation factor Spt5 [Candidatus Methanomethylicota archaeon]|uniref:Transcription elongation factor Spt5 n=1 Tax=Thermoproteota archaeon TaxID=2056631 RepID=A0A497EXD2_9CREN|nr:MAG: transcription elongation factor Spt5 [Candidatus Verstraetearchaeota archaeon]